TPPRPTIVQPDSYISSSLFGFGGRDPAITLGGSRNVNKQVGVSRTAYIFLTERLDENLERRVPFSRRLILRRMREIVLLDAAFWKILFPTDLPFSLDLSHSLVEFFSF